MGILNKIFGASSEAATSKINWIPLTAMDQLIAISKSTKTVGIFKHSTRCGTSMMVKRRFESDFQLEAEDMDLYYLDLIAHRDISNELASKFNVIHQSPQLLIIKKGQLVANESHSSVNSLDLESVI